MKFTITLKNGTEEVARAVGVKELTKTPFEITTIQMLERMVEDLTGLRCHIDIAPDLEGEEGSDPQTVTSAQTVEDIGTQSADVLPAVAVTTKTTEDVLREIQTRLQENDKVWDPVIAKATPKSETVCLTHGVQLTYKSDDETYKGFSRADMLGWKTPAGAMYLAIIQNEDSHDSWWLDGDPSLAVEELRRLYADYWPHLDPLVINIFKHLSCQAKGRTDG